MSTTEMMVVGSYCREIERDVDRTWPKLGQGLLDELARMRGRYALIVAAPAAAEQLTERLSADLGLGVIRLGADLARLDHAPTAVDLEAACESSTILTDLDVLLWPTLGVPVLRFLATRARRLTTIAVWPGEVVDSRARYSAHGRPDHLDVRLSNVVILRPRFTRYPDEVPFDLERIAR